MKDFFKYMLATMCGIIVMSILGGILFFVILMGFIAGSESKMKAKENSVFVLKLNGAISERSDEGGLLDEFITGSTGMENMGLDDIVSAINKAKNEPNIKGIYLEGGRTSFDSPATAQQVRDALEDFKKSGKWIVAYGDEMMQGAYYVSSVADELYLNETGMIDFRGMGGKSMYMKGLYDKLGVKMVAARVGRYKSYVETLTRTDMSDDDREQRMAYMQGIWNQWLEEIAQSRGTTAEQLNKMADDSIMLFASPDDYIAGHLIDKTMYPDEVQTVIRKKLGIKEDEKINQLTLDKMMILKPEKKVKEKGDEVAVYYAYGEIVDEALSGLSGGHAIVGSETVRDLQQLARDEKVKAVVIRVNSGGGSAVASEQIWRAIQQLKAKKPVVVSMGGVAASGGYMISCGANYIFAEPTTITGSIGIFGIIPNVNGLVSDKLGITFDGAATNKYTTFDDDLVYAADNSDAMQYMQSYVDRGYVRFIDIVSAGRGMANEQVHEIAQGRVWLATDALDIKLVDQLGSLDDAVKKAAQLAHMQEYHAQAYPAKKTWIEQLFSSEDVPGTYLDSRLHELLGEFYEPLMEVSLSRQRNRLQARMPYSTIVK